MPIRSWEASRLRYPSTWSFTLAIAFAPAGGSPLIPTRLRAASGSGFDANLRNNSSTNSPTHAVSRSVALRTAASRSCTACHRKDTGPGADPRSNLAYLCRRRCRDDETMPDSSNLSDPGREALTLYESNNSLPETESFRRGHGGLGSRGSLSADRNSRLC